MKVFFYILALSSLLMLPGPSKAYIRSYITAATSNGDGSYNYSGVVEDVTVAYVGGMLHRCNANSCFVSLAVYDHARGKIGPTIDTVKIRDLDKLPYYADIVKAFKKNYPLPLRVVIPSIPGSENKNQCINIALCEKEADCVLLEGSDSNCRGAPPVDLSCTFTGNTNLSHGTMNYNEVNGHQANTILDITCNQDANLKLNAFGEAATKNIILKNDGSLESSLFINDLPAYDGVKISIKEKNATQVKISSKLIQKGEVEEGRFHGAGTILMSID